MIDAETTAGDDFLINRALAAAAEAIDVVASWRIRTPANRDSLMARRDEFNELLARRESMHIGT